MDLIKMSCGKNFEHRQRFQAAFNLFVCLVYVNCAATFRVTPKHQNYYPQLRLQRSIPSGDFPRQSLSQTYTWRDNEARETEYTCQVNGLSADCSKSNWDSIPKNLPDNINKLDLSTNLITGLPEGAFQRYSQLQHLNLTNNKISYLHPSCFQNLSKLLSLDLSTNKLEMTEVMFPEEVFVPLTFLEKLRLNNNTHNVSKLGLRYPDKALSYLGNLKNLQLDGLSVFVCESLGPGFANLTYLTDLTIVGYLDGVCNFTGLLNSTFTNVRQVEFLKISDCNIQGQYIEAGSFQPLTRLRRLVLSHNEDIDFENIGRVFYGLQAAKNLTHLHLHLIRNRYSLSSCLEKSILQYFPQNLVYLDFRENNIEAVSEDVIDALPQTLEELDLSGNRFVYGSYLLHLPKLKALKKIKINGLRSAYKLPDVYPYDQKGKTVQLMQANSSCTIYLNKITSFLLQLPPNLTEVEMSNASLNYILSSMNVSELNSLKRLTLHGNYFPVLYGPIIGLTSLKYLDLSYSSVSKIKKQFFVNFTSLETLILNSNLLGSALASSGNVFSYLVNLKTLELSFNYISSLDPDVFEGLDNLETLRISKNPLTNFEVRISHLNSLKTLMLQHTELSTLSREIQKHIQDLISRDQPIRVDMSYCDISCDCFNLDFLRFMTTCGAFQANFSQYHCKERNMVTVNITDGYKQVLASLSRECGNPSLKIFIVGVSSVAVTLFIFGVTAYRFRFNIRYLYNAAYLSYTQAPKNKKDGFEYDAFICYAENDRDFAEKLMEGELTARGLKVLLHRRDFTAGEFISSNIVRAVGCSQKTLVVLTQDLLESSWCRFEIEMAKMESVYTGRQVLIFVIMEEIDRLKLNRDLLYSVSHNTYEEFPTGACEKRVLKQFWDKLARDIKPD